MALDLFWNSAFLEPKFVVLTSEGSQERQGRWRGDVLMEHYTGSAGEAFCRCPCAPDWRSLLLFLASFSCTFFFLAVFG